MTSSSSSESARASVRSTSTPATENARPRTTGSRENYSTVLVVVPKASILQFNYCMVESCALQELLLEQLLHLGGTPTLCVWINGQYNFLSMLG